MIDPMLLALVKTEEGFRSRPYLDVAGVLTIGYGETKPPLPDSITEWEASNRLAGRLEEFADEVRALVKVPITRYQYAALVSFTYNLGAWNLKRSTLLRKLNQRDYDGAAAEFRKWVKARVHGKLTPLPGLLTRRGKEEQLFRMPEHRRCNRIERWSEVSTETVTA